MSWGSKKPTGFPGEHPVSFSPERRDQDDAERVDEIQQHVAHEQVDETLADALVRIVGDYE